MTPQGTEDGKGIFENQGTKTDLTSGPGLAYKDNPNVPIGAKPTPPGTNKQIDQAAIDKAIFDSQQGKPVGINLPWLLKQPDSPSKTLLIEIVASLNKLAGS